jgi:hypothetical protein
MTQGPMRTDVEAGLATAGDRWKAKKADKFFFPRSVLKSQAFLELTSATAIKVYMLFLERCKYEKARGSPKRRAEFVHINNGELVFTYKEAEALGISAAAFRTALDQLVGHGFLDVVHPGSGLQGDVSLYAVSDRWKLYGQDGFIAVKREKRCSHHGFAKGNRLARREEKPNVRNQQLPTAGGDSWSTVGNDRRAIQ